MCDWRFRKMDWVACVICQTNANKKLRCALNAFGGNKSQAYTHFIVNVKAFRQLGRLPVELNFDEHITAEDLNLHRTQWHKLCGSKFSNTRLGRAQRKEMLRKQTPASSEDAVRKRIRNHPTQQITCIFWAKADGHLHDFISLHLDENVRCMATDLQDTTLLARIAGGDLIACLN